MSDTIERDKLVSEVLRVFGDEPVIPASELLATKFKGGIDADEMVLAYGGKHWTDIDPHDLMWHRETITMHSPGGYRAVIGAYIRAGLVSPEYGGELNGYALMSLRPLSPTDVKDTEERLSALTGDQRDVIERYLRYLVDQTGNQEGIDTLAAFRREPSP